MDTFDAELERLPRWAHSISAAVVVASLLVAARIAPMFALLPFLVVSSIGRRFASSAVRLSIDTDALHLGDREIRRANILDVWLVDDDARATVGYRVGASTELAVLVFDDRELAARFVEAAGPSRAIVAGHRPRWVDALVSVRYLAIAVAFVATGSWFGAIALPLFLRGAWSFVRARSIVVDDTRVVVASAFAERSYARSAASAVDIESGTVTLEGEPTKLDLRDALLEAPTWLRYARGRALSALAYGASQRSAPWPP